VKYDNVFRAGDSMRGKATVFTNLVDNFIDLEQVRGKVRPSLTAVLRST
jgi:hypothetical protein